MGSLFIFIFISALVVSALLFFNKGEKAQEIKSILTEIYENLKELFSNLKKLFLIVKELIQDKLDQEPTQLIDGLTEAQSNLKVKSEVTAESQESSKSGINAETEVTADSEIKTKSDVISASEINAETELKSEP